MQSGDTKLQEAITAYDEEVVPRGADEVIATRQTAFMILDWNNVMNAPIMTRSLDKGILKSENGDEKTGNGHLTSSNANLATGNGRLKTRNDDDLVEVETAGPKVTMDKNTKANEEELNLANGINGIHGIPKAYQSVSHNRETISTNTEHNALRV